MTSRPQKNPVTANAEHELARFLQAVDEFECRSDETQFDQMVRNLATPHDENDRPHVMPVRCDECYLKAELVLEGNHHVELLPASAQGCRYLPVETCPNLKAAFVRARDSRQSK